MGLKTWDHRLGDRNPQANRGDTKRSNGWWKVNDKERRFFWFTFSHWKICVCMCFAHVGTCTCYFSLYFSCENERWDELLFFNVETWNTPHSLIKRVSLSLTPHFVFHWIVTGLNPEQKVSSEVIQKRSGFESDWAMKSERCWGADDDEMRWGERGVKCWVWVRSEKRSQSCSFLPSSHYALSLSLSPSDSQKKECEKRSWTTSRRRCCSTSFGRRDQQKPVWKKAQADPGRKKRRREGVEKKVEMMMTGEHHHHGSRTVKSLLGRESGGKETGIPVDLRLWPDGYIQYVQYTYTHVYSMCLLHNEKRSICVLSLLPVRMFKSERKKDLWSDATRDFRGEASITSS